MENVQEFTNLLGDVRHLLVPLIDGGLGGGGGFHLPVTHTTGHTKTTHMMQ